MEYYHKSKQYELLKTILINYIDANKDMLEQWIDVDSKFIEWEESIYGRLSSMINHKTYIVSNVYKSFPDFYNKYHNEIDDIVLDNQYKIGDTITIKEIKYSIIGRSITIRGGVQLTLQSKDLNIISHEFFD